MNATLKLIGYGLLILIVISSTLFSNFWTVQFIMATSLKLNLHTCTANDLTLLEGIGNSKAQKIIELRKNTKDYTLEQIAHVANIKLDILQTWLESGTIVFDAKNEQSDTMDKFEIILNEIKKIQDTNTRLENKIEETIIRVANLETNMNEQSSKNIILNDNVLNDYTNCSTHNENKYNLTNIDNSTIPPMTTSTVSHSLTYDSSFVSQLPASQITSLPQYQQFSVNSDNQTHDVLGFQAVRPMHYSYPPIYSHLYNKPPPTNLINTHMSINRMPTNHMTINHVPTNHMPINHMPTNHMSTNHMPTNHVPANHVLNFVSTNSVSSQTLDRLTSMTNMHVSHNSLNFGQPRRETLFNETRVESPDTSPERDSRPTNVLNSTLNSSHRRNDRASSQSPKRSPLATFNGRIEWETFEFQFSRNKERFRWSNEKAKDRLLDCLREDALKFVRKLPVSISFEQLLEELKQRFGSTVTPSAARREAFCIKQGDQETLEEFSQRTYFLVTDGLPEADTSTVEMVAIDCFLRGCKAKQAARYSAEKQPKTLKKALEYVRRSNNIQQDIIGRSSTSNMIRQVNASNDNVSEQSDGDQEMTVRQVNANKIFTDKRLKDDNVIFKDTFDKITGHDTMLQNIVKTQENIMKSQENMLKGQENLLKHQANMMTKVCETMSSIERSINKSSNSKVQQTVNSSARSRSNSPNRPNIKCYECNEEGHFRPQCPKLKENPINIRQCRGASLIIPLKINNIETVGVIDSAANVSVLSSKFREQFCSKLEDHGQAYLTGIVPNVTVMAKKITVNIELGRTIIKHDVYVAEMQDIILIGIDLLMKTHAVIDFMDNSVLINNVKIDACIQRNNCGEEFKVHKVFMANKIELPPSSVTTHIGYVSSPLSEKESYLVEPRCSRVNDPLISCVVVKGQSEIPLQIINDTYSVKVVQKDSLVASIIPATVLEPKTPNQTCTNIGIDNDLILRQDLEGLAKSCPELNEEQMVSLRQLLHNYEDIFSSHDFDIGCIDGVEHRINTGEAKPVSTTLRRTPLMFRNEEEAHLAKLLKHGIIQESDSEWSSAPVLVRKKDGGVRWCIDFRNLNKVTVKESFPLPLIDECRDTLCGSQFFSTVDLSCGYYQIKIAPEDRKKTAFITRYGNFEHIRMGQGLVNAPSSFQRAMQLILRGLTWKSVLCYLDDVIIVGKTWDEHLTNLHEVFNRFRLYNVKLKVKKCLLARREVEYLGKVVSSDGVRISDSKVECVRSWPTPTCIKDIESFLGFVNYHRSHVENFADLTAPLYALVGGKGTKVFVWSNELDELFNKLKTALITSPVLCFPTEEGNFVLDTDASHTCISAELSQVQNGEVRTIAYASRILLKAQRKYCTTRKELLAVVAFCRHFRHYLLGRKFLVRTDHNSLVWLMRFKHIEGQLSRWIEEISQYDFDILHRKGKLHTNADALSRIPDNLNSCDCYNAGVSFSLLPCGGCQFCERAHNSWERFCEDVDDVIPLAVRSISTTDENNTLGDTPLTPLCEKTSNDVMIADNDGCLLINADFDLLREKQLQDPDIRPIITWLEDSLSPTTSQLFLCSPATRAVWVCRQQLILKNGVLFYNWVADNQHSRCLLVVPYVLRQQVMKGCHDDKTAGHFAVERTLARLRQSFFWYKMSVDCKMYVQQCEICLRNKKNPRNPKAKAQIYHAGYPAERVHMDILGPLNESAYGNKYILMIICQFTKWIECIAIPNQEAFTIVEAFLNRFMCTFGCPLQIHTDQGKNFDGDLFKVFCQQMQIAKSRTTPYRPSSNGQIERYNRTLLNMIRCSIDGHVKCWDRDLPFLVMALHAMRNRSTGFSANMMMLGREIVQPVDVVLGIAEVNCEHESPKKWVSNLRHSLYVTHNLARQHLKSALLSQKRDYDIKLYENLFQEGDIVLVFKEGRKIKQSKKLQHVYSGPYLVIKEQHPLYTIQDRKGIYVRHHDKLRINHSAVPFWLRKLRHELLSDKDVIGQDTHSDPCRDANTSGTIDHESTYPTNIPVSLPAVTVDNQSGYSFQPIPTSEQLQCQSDVASPYLCDSLSNNIQSQTGSLDSKPPLTTTDSITTTSPSSLFSHAGRSMRSRHPPAHLMDYVH